uniref:NOP56 ribonucleoprotein homolog n=1 Tax=Salmo trutta TaxID=8032 RepID=A0A673ZDX2_SALTR
QVLLHVLFEHAVGYALFVVKEVEEVGMLLPQVEDCILNMKFHGMVSLAAFFPFKSAQAALENITPYRKVSVVHTDLKLFLETNLPIGGKKKAMLGVGDAKIGGALQEELGLSIQTGGSDGQFKPHSILYTLIKPTPFLPIWDFKCPI